MASLAYENKRSREHNRVARVVIEDSGHINHTAIQAGWRPLLGNVKGFRGEDMTLTIAIITS